MKQLFLILSFLLAASQSDAQREMWGTVANGGQYGFGYIYRTDSTGDSLRVMHHFDGINGRAPAGVMFCSPDNKLYGLTGRGGSGDSAGYQGGTLYEYNLSIDSFRVLFQFNINDASFPYSGPDALNGLMEASPGILYAHMMITSIGGGMIFSFNTATGLAEPVVILPTFLGGALNTTQGNNMGNGTFYKAADGFLYGTTARNSLCPIPQPDQGGIMRIDPVTHNYSILYLNPCTNADGYHYFSSFAEQNGKLYSVSKVGGINAHGVIYEFAPATSTYTKKYDFEGGVNGKQPSTLIMAGNGKLYGTALGGTPQPPNVPGGGGIIFEYDPALSLFTKKLDFIYTTNGNVDVGITPIGTPLVLAANGKLYGKTSNGVFEYDTDSNTTRPAGRYPVFGPVPAHPSLIEICRKPSYRYSETTQYIRCEGDSVIHDLQSSAASIVWRKNGTIVPSQTDSVLRIIALSPSDTGTWIAELTNACGITLTQPLHIGLDPATATVTLIDTALQSSAAQSYQWIDCSNAAPIAGETDQLFYPLSNGSYAVITMSGNDCTDTSECFTVNFLGVPGTPAPDILIFPNPAENLLQIVTDAAIQSVTVSDALGRLVMHSGTTLLDVSALAPGAYVLSVKTGEGWWKGTFIKR